MATQHHMPSATAGWQHWTILIIVLALVLMAMMFMVG
jgi:hypothetical protein